MFPRQVLVCLKEIIISAQTRKPLQYKNAYKKYLGTLFQLTGTDVVTANKNADLVYNIEKQLASFTQNEY
jgi:hypothetical protein